MMSTSKQSPQCRSCPPILQRLPSKSILPYISHLQNIFCAPGNAPGICPWQLHTRKAPPCQGRAAPGLTLDRWGRCVLPRAAARGILFPSPRAAARGIPRYFLPPGRGTRSRPRARPRPRGQRPRAPAGEERPPLAASRTPRRQLRGALAAQRRKPQAGRRSGPREGAPARGPKPPDERAGRNAQRPASRGATGRQEPRPDSRRR